MKTATNIWLILGVLTLMTGCGDEESLDPGADETSWDGASSLTRSEQPLQLTHHIQYECICDLTGHGCGGAYPYPVIKKSSCRYKRTTRGCLGECIGRCANQGGQILSGSEFGGVCLKRKVRPNGVWVDIATDCDGHEVECSDDISEGQVLDGR